jgi:hypothetical protein
MELPAVLFKYYIYGLPIAICDNTIIENVISHFLKRKIWKGISLFILEFIT